MDSSRLSDPANKRRRIDPAASSSISSHSSVFDHQVTSVVSITTPRKDTMEDANGETWVYCTLSPSKPTIEAAEQQAAEGGFVESELGKDKYSLVLYLYGTGYFDSFKSHEYEARAKEIKKFLQDKGRVLRLMNIAFSPSSDTALPDTKGFDSYFSFAMACEHLFGNENSSKGFPGKPYLRLQQRSLQQSSNCYIAAASMFISLYAQKQDPNHKPIDVGWLARHYVTDTLDGLKCRVIENRGGSSKKLVKKVLGKFFWRYAKKSVPLHQLDPDNEKKLMKETNKLEKYLNEGHYGLVSCWKVSSKWREIGGQEGKSKSGIWCFDGSSLDSEGRFIEFNSDEDDESKRNELLAAWPNGIKVTKPQEGENNANPNPNPNLDIPFEEYEDVDEDVQESGVLESNDNAEAKRHALVLLGYTKNEQGQTLFILLNTWKKMPLVLVSLEYMVACDCKVYFLVKDLPEDFLNDKRTCGLLAAECSHPDYVEEAYYDDGEIDYEEGLSRC